MKKPTKEVITIANRLRWLRDELEVSPSKLAMEIGISANQIWNIERGDSTPNIMFVINICKFYGISIDVFVHATDAEFEHAIEQIKASGGVPCNVRAATGS